MRLTNKLLLIVATLVAGWTTLIWVQWEQPREIITSLLGIPVVMILMAVLAALAAQDNDAWK